MSSPSNNVNLPLNPALSHLTASSIHDLSPPTPSHAHSPISPTSDSKSTLLTDIFSDDLFAQQKPPLSPSLTSTFTSPRLSGSPDLQASPDPEIDPELLAREDPLATQVWRLYARAKVSLPHAQRMENLTWRMMALALKKQKEEEINAAAAAAATQAASDIDRKNFPSLIPPRSTPPAESNDRISQSLPQQPFYQQALSERGRRIDKGKARVHVVGFDGMTQDDGILDHEEYVLPCSFRAIDRFSYMK